jgi:hypothetical protein
MDIGEIKVPDIIVACLCMWVEVKPYMLYNVITRAEKHWIPYEHLIKKDFNLKWYVDTINYSDEEAGWWRWRSTAYEKLKKEFWFKEVRVEQWHRVFVSMQWVGNEVVA